MLFDTRKDFCNGRNINNEDFCLSCLDGHFRIVKRLYSIGDINIHYDNDKALNYACKNGHIEIVKWLLNLDTFIFSEYSECYTNAQKNEHFFIVNYLDMIIDTKIKKSRNNREIENIFFNIFSDLFFSVMTNVFISKIICRSNNKKDKSSWKKEFKNDIIFTGTVLGGTLLVVTGINLFNIIDILVKDF